MQQGKLRINRIRLEFKDIYALYAKDAVVVLIESDWNLKAEGRTERSQSRRY